MRLVLLFLLVFFFFFFFFFFVSRLRVPTWDDTRTQTISVFTSPNIVLKMFFD